MPIVLATVQALEIGDACAIADHCLAIDRGIAGERGGGIHDQRIAIGPFVAAAGKQSNAITAPADDQPVAIVLDLVNPLWARRRLVCSGRYTGLDKAQRSPKWRRGTPEHVNLSSGKNS